MGGRGGRMVYLHLPFSAVFISEKKKIFSLKNILKKLQYMKCLNLRKEKKSGLEGL